MPNLPDPTPPSIDEIETALRTALNKKKSEGWKIDPRVGYNVFSKRCCVLGALKHWTNGEYYVSFAAQKLGISTRDARAIEHGFMGGFGDEFYDPGLARLGQKLRKEYL